MPKDYSKGKIYRIVSASGEQYVGSTTEALCRRMAFHRSNAKNPKKKCSSFPLVRDDGRIVLVENYPCQNSEELRAREQHWIETIEGGCVNQRRARLTLEERKEDQKEYFLRRGEDETYRQKKAEIATKWNREHKEQRKRNLDNWGHVIVECECGSKLRRSSLPLHRKSAKHQAFLAT